MTSGPPSEVSNLISRAASAIGWIMPMDFLQGQLFQRA
eukprot:CAMPEP_0119340480 /NCGR_PEP_ID=MMETSP1333-20130426/100476_1 /TAXON_ID=418940 /ORGANISM="Scyphosphaera apsteinii, Strain RCC1455" /LENGTH=37 /DNA_ID= /DNA_START= /DNA_END= /DNA_ORIENTATION=